MGDLVFMTKFIGKHFVYGKLTRYVSLDVVTHSALLVASDRDSFDRLGQEVARARFMREASTFDARVVQRDAREVAESIEYDSFADWEQERIKASADSYMTRKKDLPNGAFLPSV